MFCKSDASPTQPNPKTLLIQFELKVVFQVIRRLLTAEVGFDPKVVHVVLLMEEEKGFYTSYSGFPCRCHSISIRIDVSFTSCGQSVNLATNIC